MADVPVTFTSRPAVSTDGTTTNIDFSKDLVMDYESEAPLLTLLTKMKDESVATNEFRFAIGRRAPRSSTASGAVAAVAATNTTTLNVAAGTGAYFVAGDTIEAPDTNNDATHTNQLYVVSISTDALTVRSYSQDLGVAAIDDGAIIRRIAPAMVEASSGTDAQQTEPTVYTQYAQSFEHYFSVSRLQDKNRQYTHPERARLREEARQKHVVDKEYAMFLQKKIKDTTTTGKPRYQQAGLISQISSNVLTYGASLSDTELYDFMTLVHNPAYSAGAKRLVFASGDLMASINKLASPAIRISTKESTWGPNISVVQFAGKVWEFVEAPILSEARGGWGIVTHPRYMKKRTLIPTVYEMNVQNPIDKFYKDGFYSVDAIEVKLEEVFGVIKP